MAQEQKESIDSTFDQFMQPDLGFRTGVATYLLNDRSAYRDPHLPPRPDDLPQQGLGQCTEGRQETLLRGV